MFKERNVLKIGRRNFLIFFFSIFLSSTEQTVWEGGVIHKIFQPIGIRVSPNRVGRANTYNTSRHFFIRERTINNERFYQISRKSNTNFILLKSILCNCFSRNPTRPTEECDEYRCAEAFCAEGCHSLPLTYVY